MGVDFMDRSLEPTEWKPKRTEGQHSQVALPLIGQVPSQQVLPPQIVERASFNGCLNEAVRHSGLEDQEIADQIHISHGYMSRFMRGVAQQWAKRLIAFMRVTGSLAPLQWMADQMGCDLTVRNAVSAQLAEARARVAELERQGRMAA